MNLRFQRRPRCGRQWWCEVQELSVRELVWRREGSLMMLGLVGSITASLMPPAEGLGRGRAA